MNIKHQQFDILYQEYINDYNLISIAINVHISNEIFQMDKSDIQVFMNIFQHYYQNYSSNIISSFNDFISDNDYIIVPSKSGVNYLNSNIYQLINIQDILNHYNKIYEVIHIYKVYLTKKYLNHKNKKKRTKIYRHVKRLI